MPFYNAPAYEYVVPLPPRGLGLNARGHWGKRQRLTRRYREECVDHILTVIAIEGVPPPFTRPRVTLTAYISRTRPPMARGKRPAAVITGDDYRAYMRWVDRYRPTDADNLEGACKPLLDVLGSRADQGPCVGLIPDDAATRIERGASRIVLIDDWRDEGVVVRIVEA